VVEPRENPGIVEAEVECYRGKVLSVVIDHGIEGVVIVVVAMFTFSPN